MNDNGNAGKIGYILLYLYIYVTKIWIYEPGLKHSLSNIQQEKNLTNKSLIHLLMYLRLLYVRCSIKWKVKNHLNENS